MAVKKFRFIAEQIFRCSVEVNVDLDELRKNDKYKYWTDEEILLDYSVCWTDITIGLWKRAMCVVSMARMVRKFI